MNWLPEYRKIKIYHRGVCVQIVLKRLRKLNVTKLFININSAPVGHKTQQRPVGEKLNCPP